MNSKKLTRFHGLRSGADGAGERDLRRRRRALRRQGAKPILITQPEGPGLHHQGWRGELAETGISVFAWIRGVAR